MNLSDLKEKYGEECLGIVIRIISRTQLIINAGCDVLKTGDTIAVYTIGDEILDLEGNSLGVYQHNKQILNVISTTARYSVCETQPIKRNNQLNPLTSIMSPTILDYPQFNVDNSSIKKIHLENKNKIMLGDPIKKAWL